MFFAPLMKCFVCITVMSRKSYFKEVHRMKWRKLCIN